MAADVVGFGDEDLLITWVDGGGVTEGVVVMVGTVGGAGGLG